MRITTSLPAGTNIAEFSVEADALDAWRGAAGAEEVLAAAEDVVAAAADLLAGVLDVELVAVCAAEGRISGPRCRLRRTNPRGPRPPFGSGGSRRRGRFLPRLYRSLG